jgi:hypothetical protein
VDLIRTFSERDPRDGDAENPWKNPQAMLDELDRARDQVVVAWQEDHSDKNTANDAATGTTTAIDDGDFRAAYMDMITNAFADVLEDMRSNNTEEDLDLDVLVDCLQSGIDLMTMEEKELFMGGDDEDDMEDDNGTTTPHEQRRVNLGLHVC